jgi:DNA primase
MAQWVSFDELKSRVSITDVLTHYALMQGTTEKPTKRGMELRLRCPFHEDTTPSLSISAETGKYHCFGCSHSRRRRMLLKINDLSHSAFVNIKPIESKTYAFYAIKNAASFD